MNGMNNDEPLTIRRTEESLLQAISILSLGKNEKVLNDIYETFFSFYLAPFENKEAPVSAIKNWILTRIQFWADRYIPDYETEHMVLNGIFSDIKVVRDTLCLLASSDPKVVLSIMKACSTKQRRK